ncbi:MAG: tetratricopeptide repeat protein [Candidatus Kryptonium sp.]
MTSKKCPVCDIVLPENAKFCFNCGTKLSEIEQPSGEQEQVIICDVCGFENEPGGKFCISCGSVLTGTFTSFEKAKPQKVEFKPPELESIKPKQPEIKVKSKKERKNLKLSFYQLFYLGLAIAFVGLIAYGVIRREKSKPDVHQHPEVNSEIMAEIEQLRRRVNANPDDMASTLKLANLLHDVHIFDQAVEYYRRYLEKNESDPDARVDMGICLFEIGRVDEAIAEMEKALTYAPKHQLALYNLGIVNLASGNIEKAKDYFQRCIDVNPSADVAQKAKRILEQHKF